MSAALAAMDWRPTLNWLGNLSWVLILIVGGVGAVLAYIGNMRREGWVRSLGVICIAVAAGMASLHFLIDTDEERAERQTRGLIAAIDSASKDQMKNAPANEAAAVSSWKVAQDMLDEKTVLYLGNRGGTVNGDKNIIESAVKGVKLVELKSVAPGGPQPVRVDTYPPSQSHDTVMIAVSINIVSDQEATQNSMYSSWEFDWEEASAGKPLKLLAIKLNKLNGEIVQ